MNHWVQLSMLETLNVWLMFVRRNLHNEYGYILILSCTGINFFAKKIYIKHYFLLIRVIQSLVQNIRTLLSGKFVYRKELGTLHVYR